MSNGIGPNPLNAISKIYLDQIVEKKKDDTYLEPDMKKRQANNEKARKEMEKVPGQKNPHFEEKQQGWDTVNTLADVYKTMHQDTVDEEKKKLPYVKMYRKAGNLGRDGSPEAMERSKKITGVMNKNAERVAAHREKDDAAKEAKRLRKEALDPVGKEDGDVNNDGKKDGTDKYLLNRRKAIGKAIKKKMAEEKKILSEEWVANNAAQYFFNEGLNEEGVEIFIEELGLENFVEFVHDLVEDSELIEAYALTSKKKVAKKLPKGTQPAKTTKATIARGDRKIKSASPSGAFKKRPVAAKAVETAKKQQPKKRSALDGIARTVLKGMDRHKKAMAKAKSDIETTKKIASKVGKGAREFGKGIASGVRTAGKTVKVAKKAVSEQSNWRTDLSEVMTDEMNDKPIKEKNVKNKIKINPTMGEAVEELGGTLIEEIEVDEFDYIVESVYDELIEEGFSEDDVEEAIEHSLNEVSDRYYDSAVKSSKSAAAKIKRKELKKKAVGRLKFMKRKAGEAVKSAKTKFAQAQVAGYNKGREALQKASDARRKAKQSVSNTSGRAKKGLKGFIKKQAQKVVDRMSEELVDEKFSMAADDSKPQSPRPTKLPKSRERNIGKHDDWKDNPNRDFGERPEKGKKLKSRASAVVQSQRRTDKEVGVREELSIDDQMRISKEYNRKSPEEKKAANMKVLGNIKKIAAKKDTRTDAQKMTDATGPRPGSRYRGD